MKLPEGAVLVRKLETKKYIISLYEHRINDSIIDEDRFVVKVNKETGEEILSEDNKWTEYAPPPFPRVPVKAELQKAKKVLIDPDNPFYIWEKKPKKHHPCYFVWEGAQLTIIDAVTEEVIGYGLPPPSDKGMAMSTGYEHYMENAGEWFTRMGFEVTKIFRLSDDYYPKQLIMASLKNSETKCVFQMAHGSGTWSEIVTAGDVRECMQNRDKMAFAFMGHCGGMCGADEGGFSSAYRKGSIEDTVAVGYCGMASMACGEAWRSSYKWQDKLFQYILQGMTCGDAFDEAIADYPECESCMRFYGDESFILKPTEPKTGLAIFPAYQEIYNSSEECHIPFTIVNAGDKPITETVPWSVIKDSTILDNGTWEIINLQPYSYWRRSVTVPNPGEPADIEVLVTTEEMEGRSIIHFEGGNMANIQYGVTIELEPIEGGEKIYDVRVTVNKKFTRDPIAGASVFMAGQATEITNAEGKCYFFNVPSGTYNISVSCNGYKPTTVSITLE